MAVQLVFETHAITTDNEAGIATGWLPGELSMRGRQAATELGRRRRDDGIDVVYVSDLERARETVRIAFAASAIPVTIDPRLRECNYGLLNGAPVAVIERERVAHAESPWPAGESYHQVVLRTAALLADLTRTADGSRVLLVGHSANRWALEHLLHGHPLERLLAEPFAWQPGWEFTVGRQDATANQPRGREADAGRPPSC